MKPSIKFVSLPLFGAVTLSVTLGACGGDNTKSQRPKNTPAISSTANSNTVTAPAPAPLPPDTNFTILPATPINHTHNDNANDRDITPNKGYEPDSPAVEPMPKDYILVDMMAVKKQVLGSQAVLQQIVQVEQAKAQFHIAVEGLLPKVSVGLAIGALSNPSFLLTQVSVLLPFLLPTNWFNMTSSLDLYKAQQEAYRAFELNTVADAVSLYLGLANDEAIREIDMAQYRDLKGVEETIRNAVLIGKRSEVDAAQAAGQADSAGGDLSSYDGIVGREVAALKQALNISPGTHILVKSEDVYHSELEDMDLKPAVAQVFNKAPEARQIDYLRKAAKAATWAAAFSWIGGGSFSYASYAGPGSSTNLGGSGGNTNTGTVRNSVPTTGVGGSGSANSRGGGSITITPAVITFDPTIFGQVELGKKYIDQIVVERNQLVYDEAYTVESAKQQFAASVDSLYHYQKSEQDYRTAYDLALKAYYLGNQDLNTVLTIRTNLNLASRNLVSARNNVNLNRVTLARANIEGPLFADIKGCKSPVWKKHFWSKRPKGEEKNWQCKPEVDDSGGVVPPASPSDEASTDNDGGSSAPPVAPPATGNAVSTGTGSNNNPAGGGP